MLRVSPPTRNSFTRLLDFVLDVLDALRAAVEHRGVAHGRGGGADRALGDRQRGDQQAADCERGLECRGWVHGAILGRDTPQAAGTMPT